MTVNKDSFNPIEFWSETFPHLFGQGGARDLPPCLESCQDGKWANVRHFTLKGFIYIQTFLFIQTRKSPGVERFYNK